MQAIPIQPDDPKLPDMLRKKSEIGKTSISKRKTISATMMRDVKSMLRDISTSWMYRMMKMV